MNPITVVLLGVGGLLIYAAVKDQTPVALIKSALDNGGTKNKTAGSSIPNNMTPMNPVMSPITDPVPGRPAV